MNKFYMVNESVETSFSKTVCLRSKNDKNDWTVPSHTDFFCCKKWKDKHLMENKDKLNGKKSELNDFNLKLWHAHTRKTNLAGLVISSVKNNVNAEFVTQAWCKFYEIVSKFSLIPSHCLEVAKINSVHLCEAPGAFITSLNHYLALNFKDLKWSWLATTLNPHFEENEQGEALSDDRFIIHTMDYWQFGADGTGDIFNRDNEKDLFKKFKYLGPIHLVTADGSIDCQYDPAEQENLVSSLHFCESLLALRILSSGGSFVIKMFTMFECNTVCLVYFLCCLFEEVNVFKPATSKEGNSEVYVVCLGFKNDLQAKEALEELMAYYGARCGNNSALFRENHIPNDFMRQLRECSDFFNNLQIDVLQRNIRLFNSGTRQEMAFIHQVKRTIADEFFARYNLQIIKSDLHIVGNDIIRSINQLNFDVRSEEGTFTDKKRFQSESNEQWVSRAFEILNSKYSTWTGGDICWMDQSVFNNKIFQNTRNDGIVYGKQIKTVNSSKFCQSSLLNIWNRMMELEKFQNVTNKQERPEIPSLIFGKVKEGVSEVCLLGSYAVSPRPSKMRKSGVCWFPLSRSFDLSCAFKASGSWEYLSDYALCYIYRYIVTMDEGKTLALFGLPLLTRFAVSLLHLIGSHFTKVGFCNPEKYDYLLIFYDLRNKAQLVSKLEYLKNQCFHDSMGIQTFYPVSDLCGNSELYQMIVNINHSCLRFNSLFSAERILNSL